MQTLKLLASELLRCYRATTPRYLQCFGTDAPSPGHVAQPALQHGRDCEKAWPKACRPKGLANAARVGLVAPTAAIQWRRSRCSIGCEQAAGESGYCEEKRV